MGELPSEDDRSSGRRAQHQCRLVTLDGRRSCLGGLVVDGVRSACVDAPKGGAATRVGARHGACRCRARVGISAGIREGHEDRETLLVGVRIEVAAWPVHIEGGLAGREDEALVVQQGASEHAWPEKAIEQSGQQFVQPRHGTQ